MCDPAKASQRTLEVLSESQMYRDYQRAFTEGTGLPLRLQGPNLLHVVRYAKKQENSFCALMAKIDRNCTPSSAQGYAVCAEDAQRLCGAVRDRRASARR